MKRLIITDVMLVLVFPSWLTKLIHGCRCTASHHEWCFNCGTHCLWCSAKREMEPSV